MTRKNKFILSLFLFLIIWSALNFSSLFENNSPVSLIIKAFPGYLLMVFGCYSLFSIGSELFQLKEFPEEHSSLVDEINIAKLHYKNLGIQLE